MNRRFNPSNKDLSNYIYASRMQLVKSKCDLENLEMQIEQWKATEPEDNFYFVAPESDDNSGQKFLFIYQSQFQRHLLQRYGNDICLLDATYRTTRYAVPLFFLCVKTNMDYSVAAVFASQSEDTATISEALKILNQWNPQWQPTSFMVDFSDAEINALQATFPGK